MDWTAGFQGLIGGVLIGLSATWLMATLGRIAGISGIVTGLMTARPGAEGAWRLTFVLGLISGPVLVALAGLGNVTGSASAVIGAPAGGVTLMLLAGFLVGAGSGIGGGCTSGHGVCGLARFSPRSLAATLTFMLTAIVTVYVVRHLLGGGA